MRNLNKVAVSDIIKKVEHHNLVATTYATLYVKIIEILKKFEGKKMSARIQTALKNAPELQGYAIHFQIHAGMYQINFWGKELSYEDRNHLFLGYTTGDGLVHIDYILEQNKGFLNGRIIDPASISERVKKYNDIVDQMEKFQEENDDIWYTVTEGKL